MGIHTALLAAQCKKLGLFWLKTLGHSPHYKSFQVREYIHWLNFNLKTQSSAIRINSAVGGQKNTDGYSISRNIRALYVPLDQMGDVGGEGEQLEGWERDSGGLSLVQREELAPLRSGTDTHTHPHRHISVCLIV